MSGKELAQSSTNLEEAARALTEAAQALTRVAKILASHIPEPAPEMAALDEQIESLAAIADTLESQRGEEAQQAEAALRRAHLRRAVMSALSRGPALPVELAAATLSLPDELRPILYELHQEGLVAVREAGVGQLIALTARGRQALHR